MPDERLTTVVVGKLHISSWVAEELRGRIIELLSKREEYEQFKGKGKEKFLWVFCDLFEKNVDDNTIIFARLGKNKKETGETIFDKQNWTYKRIVVNSPKAESYSNFIIIPKSQTILFEEKKGIISTKQFTDMFSLIYSRHFNDLSSVIIDLLSEKEKIFYYLKEYEKITKVQFDVRPSNPETDEDFKQLDDFLKNSRTKKGSFEFENDEEGLEIDNNLISQGINLSSSGYGNAKITVKKGNETRIIDTKSQILRFVVPAAGNPDSIANNLYKQYIEFIHRGESRGLQ